jgi:hypothetical protein
MQHGNCTAVECARIATKHTHIHPSSIITLHEREHMHRHCLYYYVIHPWQMFQKSDPCTHTHTHTAGLLACLLHPAQPLNPNPTPLAAEHDPCRRVTTLPTSALRLPTRRASRSLASTTACQATRQWVTATGGWAAWHGHARCVRGTAWSSRRRTCTRTHRGSHGALPLPLPLARQVHLQRGVCRVPRRRQCPQRHMRQRWVTHAQ